MLVAESGCGAGLRGFSGRQIEKVVDFELLDTTHFQGTPQAKEPELLHRMSARGVDVPQIKHLWKTKMSIPYRVFIVSLTGR
jgi:hypothetical protein